MAKRSKKKNPNLLTESQKADVRFNMALDEKKKGLDLRLNITLGIVIGVFFLAFLILPTVNMNFSGSLSDILGSGVSGEEDQTISVQVNMSFVDFLTALAGKYENSLRYLAEHTDSDANSDIIYAAFSTQANEEDIEALDRAYIVALAVTAVLLASAIVFSIVASVARGKKKDGVLLLVSAIAFTVSSIAQWILFLIVGAAASSKGQIQPHISSYLILAAGATFAVVYAIYRKKIKKLKAQRREVPLGADKVGEKI